MLHLYPDQILLVSMVKMLRYVIHITLLIGWCVSLNRRLQNRQVRCLLILVGILMAFWLTVRTIKFEFIADPTHPIVRYLWYCYYIPMVLIPMIGVFVVKYLDKLADYTHPKQMNLLLIPAFLLLGIVFTNDLHRLVFDFPQGIELFDSKYTYGFVYYILMAWFILGGLYFVVMLLKKSRVPGSKKMQRLPLFIMLGAIVFWVLYTLKLIKCDLTAMDCLIITCLLESAIQSGIIPSNTNHRELFDITTVPVQIVDADYQPHYVSGAALPLSEADLKKTEAGAVHMDNTLLRSTPITAGRVVWQDDITVQNTLRQQLQDIREQMSEENTLLQAEVELTEHKAKVDEQNRLYDRIAQEVAPQLIRAEELMQRVSAEPEKARELMAKICVLGCYIKRRGNLLLLGEESKEIPSAELEQCVPGVGNTERRNRRYGDADGAGCDGAPVSLHCCPASPGRVLVLFAAAGSCASGTAGIQLSRHQNESGRDPQMRLPGHRLSKSYCPGGIPRSDRRQRRACLPEKLDGGISGAKVPSFDTF